MADTYNEDDELTQVLNWLKTNGPALAAGIALGLIIIVGWKWWNARIENRAHAAAQLYGSVIQQIESGNIDQQVRGQVAQLKQDYTGSPYAANAALRLAALAVEQRHYDKALGQLDWVIDNSESVPIRNLAQVRKARVLWTDGQTDAALQLLETKHPKSFDRLYAELIGDIHAALGQRADAHAAYQRAVGAADGSVGRVLQRKLAQTAQTQASVASVAAVQGTDEGA